VVLGGRSAGSRDAKMRELIEANIDDASTKPGVALVAEAKPEAAPAPAAKPQLASAEPAPVSLGAALAREVSTAISPGSTAPLTPVKVKTVVVKLVPPKNAPEAKPQPARTAELTLPGKDEALAETLAAAAPIGSTPSVPFAPADRAPATTPGVLGKLPAMMAAAKEAAIPSARAEPVPAAKAEVAKPSKTVEHFPSAPPRHATRSGWAIQVGAYEDEGEAKQHLTSAKSKVAQALHKAEAYIERTVKGAKTYYRARFAGFDRDQAEAVCKRLKREDVACMALKI
jgi:D-alanyl-D-alanine carboxypeptidase